MRNKGNIEILVRFDTTAYIAQCVQYDICGQGDTPAAALSSCAYSIWKEESKQGSGLEVIEPPPERAVELIRELGI